MLGIELYEVFPIGPVEVRRLAVTLPNLKFPVDLSGGVRLFRNRRGRLEYLSLGLRLETLARWLDARLRGALGGLVRPVSAFRVPEGLGIGLVGELGAVAFDLLWVPSEGDARVVVGRVRGGGLSAPALGVVLQIVDTAFARVATRTGRVLLLKSAGLAVAREVMPAVGARAPKVDTLRCSVLEGEGDTVTVGMDASFPPAALGETAIRALELADLTASSDDALARGDVEAARAGYVAALERAPRHPELSRLVAEIDVHAGGRAESALSMLSETLFVSETGAVAATLLARTGDTEGACEALRAATRNEEYAPLAALLFCELAALDSDARSRLRALDDAVARCPGLASVRWKRFEAQLSSGSVKVALGDAEHLEAGASGNRARHAICRQVAERFLAMGYEREAGRLFERALRYLPDDAEATAGLGRALLESGKTNRAATLLERAVALGEAEGRPRDDALVDLAKILAKMSDLPQAIARIRRVTADSGRLVEARALEAGWREVLGDVAGASLTYARLREAVELGRPANMGSVVEWLKSAARFEWETRKDAPSAERHLAVALRLSPRDRSVNDAYRNIAAIVGAMGRREG